LTYDGTYDVSRRNDAVHHIFTRECERDLPHKFATVRDDDCEPVMFVENVGETDRFAASGWQHSERRVAVCPRKIDAGLEVGLVGTELHSEK